ncbi:MAG TPA: hypothetical protein VM658_09095 [bacterium]|nr:hypothetical protein [bacterium]
MFRIKKPEIILEILNILVIDFLMEERYQGYATSYNHAQYRGPAPAR